MRKLIIGDVHGCLAELKNVLNKVEINIEKDMLIFVGDLIDRGPDSIGVVNFVSELSSRMGNRLVYLYGNHEDMLLRNLYDWSHLGEKEKLIISALTENWYEDNDLRVCHAGCMAETLVGVDPQMYIWETEPFMYGTYNGKLTIVGHSAIVAPTLTCGGNAKQFKYETEYELPKNGMVGIDTGCVYGNCLTAMIVENGKCYFVKENKI